MLAAEPPSHPKYVSPRRLPERKRMTIALGILARDGVVIAADSEETGGYSKSSVYKVLERHGWMQIMASGAVRIRAVAATGAGHAAPLDALNQQLLDVAMATHGPKQAQIAVTKAVEDFHNRYILPSAHLSPPPAADIVFGASWAGERPILLASGLGTVRRSTDFVATGYGQDVVQLFLSRTLPALQPLDASRAAHLAAYAVYLAKEDARYCGKETHILVLRNGRVSYLATSKVTALERAFAAHRALDARAVNYILGRSSVSASELIASLTAIRSDLGDDDGLVEVPGQGDPFEADREALRLARAATGPADQPAPSAPKRGRKAPPASQE